VTAVRVRTYTLAARAALVLGLVLSLAACGSGDQSLRAWIHRIETEPPAPLAPVPRPVPYQPPAFSAAHLRSPFVPSVRALPSTVRPNPNRPRQYLERFPLDSLRLLGTLVVGHRVYALVQDPHGIVHRVTYGNYLGQNDGKIVAIRPNGLVLREILPNGTGGWVVTRVFVPLSKQPGG
jgi:type IV pilus assembly protein PilP